MRVSSKEIGQRHYPLRIEYIESVVCFSPSLLSVLVKIISNRTTLNLEDGDNESKTHSLASLLPQNMKIQ